MLHSEKSNFGFVFPWLANGEYIKKKTDRRKWYTFQSRKQKGRNFFSEEDIGVDGRGLHLQMGKQRLREGKLVARNHTANRQQPEDLNSALSDVIAHVLIPNAHMASPAGRGRSDAWPCIESGNMSHWSSPRMAGE